MGKAENSSGFLTCMLMSITITAAEMFRLMSTSRTYGGIGTISMTTIPTTPAGMPIRPIRLRVITPL